MPSSISRTALAAACFVAVASIASAEAAPKSLLSQRSRKLPKDALLRAASAVAKGRGEGMALISEMAQKASGKKQSPQGITNWIKSMLLPQANQTRMEMQHEVDAAAREIKECYNGLKAASSQVNSQASDLSVLESDQSACLLQQSQLSQKVDNLCGDYTMFSHTMGAPMDLQEAKDEQATKRGTDVIENSLRRNYEFLNDYFPKLMDKKKGCLGSTAELEGQKTKCDSGKIATESSYCSIDVVRTKACSAYDECYVTKKDNLNTVTLKVKELEVHTKSQFQSMSCFGDTMGGAVPADNTTNDCDPATVATTHLDVDYPELVDKSDCIDPVKTTLNMSAFACTEDGMVKSAETEKADESSDDTDEAASEDAASSEDDTEKDAADANATVAETNATGLADSSEADDKDADADDAEEESSNTKSKDDDKDAKDEDFDDADGKDDEKDDKDDEDEKDEKDD